MICAIHQPNFMPWTAYFEKIAASDVFVIMINCQYERCNYQNRFMFNDKWQTMSVNNASSKDLINQKQYLNPEKDWQLIKTRLNKYELILSLFDSCIEKSLAQTNIKIIKKGCELLGIKTKIEIDFPTNAKASQRLIEICLANGADTYLAGSGGSKTYLEVPLFEANGIKVLFQDPLTMTKEPLLMALERFIDV